jgi:hypothetical protein
MCQDRIDALAAEIKRRRDEYHDRTYAAYLAPDDPAVLENARLAAERVADYDSLLAIIEGIGERKV